MSKKEKYYFLTTVMEGSKVRCKVLAGQSIKVETLKGEVEEECIESWNVQCDKVARSKAPLGTIFITDKLEKRATFYNAGNLSVLTAIKDLPVATARMVEAYDNYRDGSKVAEDFVVTDDSTTTTTTKTGAPARRGKSYMQRLYDNPKYNPPTVEDGFVVSKENWYLLLRNVLNQIPTILIGQTGTGKTELVTKVAKAIKYDLNIFDMGSMQDPIAGLLGVHRLQAGKSIFDFSKFTKAIQQEKSIVLLDELSRAPITSNNLLFPCLDFRRALPVEMAGGEDMREIPIADNCAFIATANLGGEYTGTSTIDRALLDRFMPIELEYLKKDMECKLLMERVGIEEKFASQITTIAETLRKLYNAQELSTFVSTRATLQVAELIIDGFSTLTALELVFLPLFEGTKLEGERNIVANVITSR